MTNDFNDLDQPEMGSEEVPPPRGIGANLGEAWRTRPLFKLMALMVVVAAVVAASVSLFSSHPSTDTAHLVKPPSMHEAPGGPASPYFVQQTKEADAAREQQAMANGSSALPTPIGATADVNDLSNNDKKNDPLIELRAEQKRVEQQLSDVKKQQQQVQQQQGQQPPEQFDNSLATAMQRQMQQLMEGWTPKGVKSVTVTEASAANNSASTSSTNTSSNTNNPTNPASTNPYGVNGTLANAKILVPAGTVSYAQLLTEANSDVPGPILAQIVSGPLAGARAVGSFQVANGYADYLVLQFSVADKKGIDYSVNAIALDPDTTLGGMATEVDQRYFTRVVLPAAAGFLQGFGNALGTGSSSIVTNGTTTIVTDSNNGIHQGIYQGMSNAANTAGQFFQNQADNTRPLVRVAAGTPMGLFFVTSVTDTTVQQLQQLQLQSGVPITTSGQTSLTGTSAPGGIPGLTNSGIPGVAPYGPAAAPYGYAMPGVYPGTTVPGYGSYPSALPYPNAAAAPYSNPGASSTPTINVPGLVNNTTPGVGTTTYAH